MEETPTYAARTLDGNRDGVIDGGSGRRHGQRRGGEAAADLARGQHRDPDAYAAQTGGRALASCCPISEEFALLRRYRWRMRLGFGASLLLGAALALMLSTRL